MPHLISRASCFILIFSTILFSCSEPKKPFSPQTLKTDILSFSEDEQTLFLDFLRVYQQQKTSQDSIYGLAMSQIESLSYHTILGRLKERQAWILDEFGHTGAAIYRYVAYGKEEYIDGVTCHFWYVSENFLENDELKMIAGRKYAPEFDSHFNGVVMISNALADRLGVFIGDKIDPYGRDLTVVGIFANYSEEQELIITTVKE